jgi:SAM-dependent methyltransferase
MLDSRAVFRGPNPGWAATGRQRSEIDRTLDTNDLHNQDRQWSRHAARYDEIFLDPYGPNVENPLWAALAAVPRAACKTVADLGCGTGPLLPDLADRFDRVIALDFAPGMLKQARNRLDSEAAARVTFVERPMHDLDQFAGKLDVAVAINSLVMPDVRLIDRTLRSIRASLKPGGQFMGIVPSIDAIVYHLMLLREQALNQGLDPKDADRLAALRVDSRHYDFAFGQFHFQGLRQKFWEPFEVEYRLTKAGFSATTLSKVLYPWDDDLAGGNDLAGFPRSWDWFFLAFA